MRSKRRSSKRVWRAPDDAPSLGRAWFEDAETTPRRDVDVRGHDLMQSSAWIASAFHRLQGSPNQAGTGKIQGGKIMRIKAALFGVVLALAGTGPAAAEFPDKPIRIMAPYAPGGNIDVTARIIAEKLREVLGVTVLVDNKAGASGMIGSDVIARSAPDGYNLLVSANSLVVTPTIYGNAPYDWKTAFQPISHIQAVPAVLVVNPSSPIKTLADFIKIGRETPGQLAIAD